MVYIVLNYLTKYHKMSDNHYFFDGLIIQNNISIEIIMIKSSRYNINNLYKPTKSICIYITSIIVYLYSQFS